MRFSFNDAKKFDDWRYNLILVAPGKGEAKKTVSQGFIRLELSAYRASSSGFIYMLEGTATDDILSINSSMAVTTEHTERESIWVTPQHLKSLEVKHQEVELENDPAYTQEFDKIFWEEHVLDSIFGQSRATKEEYITLNPDRFGKMGLLRPRGLPFEYQFVEWADQNIIRWFQGDTDTRGVYTYGKR